MVRGVHAEQRSSLFQQVNFVGSQRLLAQISTMGIIPPRLCWSFHWLREAMQLRPVQGGVGGSRKVSRDDSLWPFTKDKNEQTNPKWQRKTEYITGLGIFFILLQSTYMSKIFPALLNSEPKHIESKSTNKNLKNLTSWGVLTSQRCFSLSRNSVLRRI